MVYVTLDTCVLFSLLKADIRAADNFFDEFLFLAEKRHITFVTTKNINREWQRHKIAQRDVSINHLKKVDQFFKANIKDDVFRPANQTEVIAAKVDERIGRLDQLFVTLAEEAQETSEMYVEAGKMNLACVPPNHSKDSFRDTINILSLSDYLKEKKYTPCLFVTNNHTDFSTSESRFDLHPGLVDIFSVANLQYVYFETDANNYGGKLKHSLSKYGLPPYSDYLKEQQRIEESKLLEEKSQEQEIKIVPDDVDFLNNIQYLDLIMVKESLTDFEKKIMDQLFRENDAYRLYFMKNIKP